MEDAFQNPWDNLDVYAFPPFSLIQRVLVRVRASRNLRMTLVAPFWPHQIWFPDLLELLVAEPFRLPVLDKLLMQPVSRKFHTGAHVLNLHAWRLSSVSSEVEAFLEEQRLKCPVASGSVHLESTRVSGTSGALGAVRGAWIRSRPLSL